jgi:capsular exopolysaccharide synthesis family protein
MDLRDYGLVITKRWVSILLITVLGLAIAATMTYRAPKIYTATSQSFIAITVGGDGAVASLAAENYYTLQRIQSYLQIINSPGVLQPVIDELGLNVTVQQLASTVSAANPTETVLVNITVSRADPQEAAGVANAVAVQLGAVVQRLETSNSGTVVPVKLTLTIPAQPPSSPSSPKPRTNLILGLLIGLALGVALAFLRESLDRSIKSPEEVTDLTGAATVGVLSYDPTAKGSPIVALEQRSTRAEAFRTVRTNLQYVDVDRPPTVVAITSAVPGEGKTTLALNLAITLAQAGRRVALIETDLRRPKASKYLGVDSELGLTDVLSGQHTLVEAMVPWNRGLLDFLPAGHTPPNPSELLASHQFTQLLATLREQYDSVIIDSTPLLPVTDGAIVAKAADGAILVVRFGKTTRDQVASSVTALQQVDARVLGTVLNFVPTGRRGYGYKYGYKYGNKYGYGYGYGYESEHAKGGRDE